MEVLWFIARKLRITGLITKYQGGWAIGTAHIPRTCTNVLMYGHDEECKECIQRSTPQSESGRKQPAMCPFCCKMPRPRNNLKPGLPTYDEYESLVVQRAAVKWGERSPPLPPLVSMYTRPSGAPLRVTQKHPYRVLVPSYCPGDLLLKLQQSASGRSLSVREHIGRDQTPNKLPPKEVSSILHVGVVEGRMLN